MRPRKPNSTEDAGDKAPVLPPVLAGIRACKSDRPTFPRNAVYCGDRVSQSPMATLGLPLRGQHTLDRRTGRRRGSVVFPV